MAAAAKAQGRALVAVVDEAHFASTEAAAAIKLLRMVDATAGDVGVAASATPDAEVMALPGLELDYTTRPSRRADAPTTSWCCRSSSMHKRFTADRGPFRGPYPFESWLLGAEGTRDPELCKAQRTYGDPLVAHYPGAQAICAADLLGMRLCLCQ